MDSMFEYASKFNQNLCPWSKIPTFPYSRVSGMFLGSGCSYQSSPVKGKKLVLLYPGAFRNGKNFCASDCKRSPSNYNTNDDNNEPIANDSHQLSVQVTALARASTSSTSAKIPKKCCCFYPGTNKCPNPKKPCSCR